MNGLLKFAFPGNPDRNKDPNPQKTFEIYRKWNLNNVKSPTFLERLKKEYSLSPGIQNNEENTTYLTNNLSPEQYQKYMVDKIKKVTYTPFRFTPTFPKERRRPGMYSSSSNGIMTTPENYTYETGEMPFEIKYKDTYRHELGHIRGSVITDTETNANQHILSPYAVNLFNNTKDKVFNNTERIRDYIHNFSSRAQPNVLEILGHRTQPTEMYAQLNEVRGRLLDQLKFNYSDTFTQEIFNKAKENKLFKDTFMEFLDYQDLAPIFNTIAKSNNTKQSLLDWTT